MLFLNIFIDSVLNLIIKFSQSIWLLCNSLFFGSSNSETAKVFSKILPFTNCFIIYNYTSPRTWYTLVHNDFINNLKASSIINLENGAWELFKMTSIRCLCWCWTRSVYNKAKWNVTLPGAAIAIERSRISICVYYVCSFTQGR